MSIKSFAWFETNQVVIMVEDGTSILLLENPKEKNRSTHGSVSNAHIDLTLDKAEELAKSILRDVEYVRKMNDGLVKYEEEQKKKENI